MAKTKQPKKPSRHRARKVARPAAVAPAPLYCDHCAAPLFDDKYCLRCCAACGGDLADGRCPLCDLSKLRRLRAGITGMFATPANEALALLLDMRIAEMSTDTREDGDGDGNGHAS